MIIDPLRGLLRSRKFLTVSLDAIATLVLYFGAKYLGDSIAEDIKLVILVLQAPVLMLIYTIAQEDIATTEASALIEITRSAQAQVELDA